MLKAFNLLFLIGVLNVLSFVSTDDSDFLLVSEKYRLRGVSLDGGSYPDVIPPVNGLVIGVAVDFSADTDELIWSDVGEDTLSAINYKNQTKRRTILNRMPGIVGIAVDWIGQNVYFTDNGLNVVGVVSMDGRFSKLLFTTGLDQPRAIEVDPEAGYIYWTDWGQPTKIERAFMSGENRQAIITTGIRVPTGLALDRTNKRLYWIDSLHDRIESCEFDGTDRKVIMEMHELGSRPFDLTLHGSDLYWTDWSDNAVYKMTIHKGTCTSVTRGDCFSKYKQLQSTPYGMIVYDRSRANGMNKCSIDNGGCSQLCLAVPSGSVCACSYGLLQSDNKTCEDPDKYLLLADFNSIRGFTLDEDTMLDAVKPTKGLTRAIAVDYDHITGDVYYSDVTLGIIARVTKRGTINALVTFMKVPDGVAVDWISRTVYYTDGGWNIIGMIQMNGRNPVVLINDNLHNPRDIALDLKEGLMFWTDWGSVPKIEMARMDGTGRAAIVTKDLAWPNGLVLDTENKIVYWVDARLDRVEKCTYNGANRILLVQTTLIHPYGLVLDGSYLYWSDWIRETIIRFPLNGTGIGDLHYYPSPLPGLTRPSGLVLHDTAARKSIQNHCSHNNGNCPQFCIPIPGGRFCACNSRNATVCKPTVSIEAFSPRTSHVTLHCNIGKNQGETGIPLLQTRFYKDGLEIPTMRQTWSDGLSVKTVSYYIQRATGRDEGIYFCVAINKYGAGRSGGVNVIVSNRDQIPQ